jgi:hypothetical protein
MAMPPLPKKKRKYDALVHKAELLCITVILGDFAGPLLLEKNKIQLQIHGITGLAAIKAEHLHWRKRRGQLGK